MQNYDKIEIQYFDKMSNKTPSVVAEINESKKLEEIDGLLRSLPDVGNEMIKMGNVPVLRVQIFFSSGGVEYFEFYGGRIKTPDTSFYSGVVAAEVKLYNILRSYV